MTNKQASNINGDVYIDQTVCPPIQKLQYPNVFNNGHIFSNKIKGNHVTSNLDFLNNNDLSR